MEGFSQTTEEIGQNGRRGALMISIDCHHPDLIDFIDIKTKEGAVTKANISVRVTDDFMRSVKNNEDWVMSFYRPETDETITKTMPAREIFHKLCKNNWDWAEPGILYWDRITDYNLLSNNEDFEYAGVNPCAEEPLPAGGSCLLGSINLAEFVENGRFNYTSFMYTVRVAVGAMNRVLDEGLKLHPLEEQQDSVAKWRQIGLGVMGIADMLIKMGLRYDSQEAINLCDKIGQTMAEEAIYKSSCLAENLGSYPAYCKEATRNTPFYKENCICDDMIDECVIKNGLRNSQLLTIAPTGTISTMIGVSGGIEPIFANSYKRKTQSLHGKDVEYTVYTPIVDKYMKAHCLKDEKELPDYFVTSSTINPMKRIEMQAAWQKHIDASISSTINLPNSATIEEVEALYMYAWECGLKGLTIYRDGCKRSGILTTNSTPTEDNHGNEKNNINNLSRGTIINCSNDLIGKKRKVITGCGSLHVLAYFDPVNGNLQEVYLSKGSTGGCNNSLIGLSRTISLLCRAGVDLYTIKDQLDSTGSCPSYAVRSATKHDTSKGSCCPMAVGNALIDMYEEMQDEIGIDEDSIEEDNDEKNTTRKDESNISQTISDKEHCPICGEKLMYIGGCIQCTCGWSKCD